MELSISPSEWEVMRVVWAQGECKSKDIVSILHQKFSWSESTVKTLVARLVDKKYLEAERQGRAYLYRSLVEEKVIYQAELSQVLNKICQRQHFELLEASLDKLPMTAQQLASLEALLSRKKDSLVAQVPCNCLAGQCACGEEECCG